MTPTASPLEIISAIINLIGIVTAGYMLYMTLRRFRAVRAQPARFPTGREILAAWRHIRCEVGRLSFHMTSITLGMWAMALPDSGSSYALAAMTARMLLGLVFTVFSIMDLDTDAKLWAKTRRGAPQGRAL